MKQKIHPPKNIVISHVYSSDNKGDAALTSVLIDDLKRQFSGANITILRLEPVKERSYFEGVPEKPSFMCYALNRYKNPLDKLAYAIYMMSATLAYAALLRTIGRRLYLPLHLREVVDIYEQADLIVPVGGGYIRSRKGLLNRLNVPLLLHPLLFGYLLGKPTVLYAQSVGPFQNTIEKRMTAYVLKRMTLIMLREDTSLKLLEALGVTQNVSRAIDSGFLLRSDDNLNIRKLYHIPAGKLLVGVTVRSWLSGGAQSNYEKAVASSLDKLVETSNAHVLFIPQVTAAKGDDDRHVSRRAQNQMHRAKASTLIEDTPDHHKIKAIYDGLDILVGTRFHSVIFSLTSYVPVLAIEYEHKTSGIMRDLQLEGWVIKIEDATSENLTKLLQKLVGEQSKYRTHLHRHLPPYLHKAKQNIEILNNALLPLNDD
jgi:colanic acid/amylovoran biosynthesis protein